MTDVYSDDLACPHCGHQPVMRYEAINPDSEQYEGDEWICERCNWCSEPLGRDAWQELPHG